MTGENITAAKYMADHQVHADSQTLVLTEDYSSSVGQMQSQTDPGEVGSESQATTAAAELERLRYAIAELKGETYWYTSALGTMAGATLGVWD